MPAADASSAMNDCFDEAPAICVRNESIRSSSDVMPLDHLKGKYQDTKLRPVDIAQSKTQPKITPAEMVITNSVHRFSISLLEDMASLLQMKGGKPVSLDEADLALSNFTAFFEMLMR